MAKLTRVTQKQFGGNGSSGNYGKFGSKAAGSPVYTTDPATIQALAAFTNEGWADAVVDGNVPELEDMNGLFLLAFYQLVYLFQEGVPEWDSGTTYYTNSIAKYNGELYLSLQDTNLNKNPSSETAWWSSILGSRAVQTGVIQAYGGSSAPTGYLLCDGSAVSRSTYSALFAIVGTSFGSGDGSTTFNLPDLRTKVPAGYKSGDDTFGTLGASVGSKTVNLQHSHGGVATPITQSSSPNTSPQGVNIGDQHREQYATIANDLSSVQSIVQPSLTINYIIKT